MRGRELFTSSISAVEVTRVAQRVAAPARPGPAGVLRRVSLVACDEQVLTRAGTVPPAMLRSLDAIHLATALLLAPEVELFVAYDARLADAARSAGLDVVAPS